MNKMSKRLNFVHNDEIWKDHVRHEMQSFTNKWPEKWGFLTKEYQMMSKDLSGGRLTFEDAGEKNVKLPPIEGSSKSTYPVTTAQMIGWKSRSPENQLELYGRYGGNARGQIGILKQFNWPREGL